MRQDAGCSEQEFERDVKQIEEALRTLVLPDEAQPQQRDDGGSSFPWASVAVTATFISAAVLGGFAAV